jgi:peptide chain release factor
MQLNETFSISPKKVALLKAKIIDLKIDLSEIEEKFTKGSGSGGQKTNKSNNCVQLHHIPSGIRVRCHKERERNKNRFLALRELVDKIEKLQIPSKNTKLEKIKKQKQRRKRKTQNRLIIKKTLEEQ